MQTRGKFITFEGGEGCGKSTQIALLAAFLRAQGQRVKEVREPGGTPLCEKIRALVREKAADAPVPRAELLLFLAARAQLVETTIAPALARGDWVLSDRFCDSTFAYQGYGRGFDLDETKRLNRFATNALMPDLTFLLDLPPALSAARLAGRQKQTATEADRMESAGAAFHARLHAGFLALAAAEPERFVILDAAQSVDVLAAAIREATSRRFP